MIIFTKENLEEFSMKQLKNLARYYNIDSRMKKSKLIDLLYDKINPKNDAVSGSISDSSNELNVNKSARVLRIEGNKND